jgi:hypothetical protein
VRTCFFAFFVLLESRYLVPTFSSIELVTATAVVLSILRSPVFAKHSAHRGRTSGGAQLEQGVGAALPLCTGVSGNL